VDFSIYIVFYFFHTVNIGASVEMNILVNLRGMARHAPSGRAILSNVDLVIRSDEKLALLGPNGAGKTTLLRMLAGLVPPSAGRAGLGSLDLFSKLDRKKAPTLAGLVFAHTDDQLLQSTVLEEVALGPLNLGKSPLQAKELSLRLLEQFHLSGHAMQSPFELSSGEKKRLALASILAMEPKLLLLDEPTHYLDQRGKRSLVETLKGWNGALIVATHEPAFARSICPRVAVMDEGQIAFDGCWEDLEKDPNFLEIHGVEPVGNLPVFSGDIDPNHGIGNNLTHSEIGGMMGPMPKAKWGG
jgi:energy-coupling factor transporter ATP-binding protein EcfA2